MELIRHIFKPQDIEVEEPKRMKPKEVPCITLANCGVMPRYQGMTFDKIKDLNIMREDDRGSYRRAFLYARNIREQAKEGTGVLLRGSVGTGKTCLAVAIAHKAYEVGYTVQFVNAINLRDELFRLWKGGDREALGEYDRKLRTVKFLVIDDLGAESHEDSHDWIVDKIESIIGERHARMLPTIITTNLGNKQIKEKYNARIFDRIKEMCIVLNFVGDSTRETPKERSDV